MSYKEFISVLKKLYRLTSDFQELSMRIRSQIGKQEGTPFEQQSLKNDFEKRSHLLDVFAQSGLVIYREAVRLQLPTRPDNVLHLALNWYKSKNDAEIDSVIDRAEAETLQMILEAQALRTKTTSGKTGETQNESDDLITKIKKRLDGLSQKIRPKKAVSQAVNIHRKTLVKRKVLTEAEINRGFVRSWTAVRNEARSIFNEAAGAGIKLPNVPAADGTVWSFERLQSWLDESLYKISKLQKHIPKTDSGGKAGKTKTIAKKLKKPISDKTAAVYELLKMMPEHRGLTGRKIIEELSKKNIFIDQSTLTKNIIPILKKDYGVKNQPRIGYYVEK